MKRHRSIALVVAVKVVIVALVLALPSGVALSLGAAHGVALLLAAVAAAAVLLTVRQRGRRSHEGGHDMLTAETTIETAKASRYLVQLCEHGTKVGHLHTRMTHARPEVLDVECSETSGILTLSWGRCVLDANPTTLTVRVEADSQEHLRGVQDLVTADLERFGRREQLAVAWPV